MTKRSGPGWPMNWLVLLCTGFALAGCNTAQPTRTPLPTVPSPVPSKSPQAITIDAPGTPTPLAIGFASWRTATLENGQSFDFRQETIGAPTEGDLYFGAFDPLQGTACFWANNEAQIGGRDLGALSTKALGERSLPRDRYSGQCMAVIPGHVYVYGIVGDERLAVLRVVDTGLNSVVFEYILRQ